MVSYQYYLMLVVISASFAAIITPFVIGSALKHDIVDRPGLHKTHLTSIPLLGGMVIYTGFIIALFIFLPLNTKMVSLLIASMILVITGIYDDLLDIRPLQKLAGQGAAAAIVVFFNYSHFSVLLDFFSNLNIPEIVTLFLITGWIMLMTNAFNLIDGLDGLAVGVGAIIFLGMAVNTLALNGSFNILSIQLIGFGACVGFLPYNYNPARIFMGDAGSMLLGFLLSTTFLFSITSPFSGSLVLGTIFIFAYPAFDVTYAIYRRLRSGCSILKPDRCHIHHILRSLGFSVRKTVLIIYLINAVFAGLGIMLLYFKLPAYVIGYIGLATALLMMVTFRYLARLSHRKGLVIEPESGEILVD